MGIEHKVLDTEETAIAAFDDIVSTIKQDAYDGLQKELLPCK